MRVNLEDHGTIRTRPHPQCILCGSQGVLQYSNQTDRLFNATGRWNLKKCRNLDCELMWLDPLPVEEDIGQAYADYYTHSDASNQCAPGLVRSAYRYLKRQYISSRYNYRNGANGAFGNALGKVLYL